MRSSPLFIHLRHGGWCLAFASFVRSRIMYRLAGLVSRTVNNKTIVVDIHWSAA